MNRRSYAVNTYHGLINGNVFPLERYRMQPHSPKLLVLSYRTIMRWIHMQNKLYHKTDFVLEIVSLHVLQTFSFNAIPSCAYTTEMKRKQSAFRLASYICVSTSSWTNTLSWEYRRARETPTYFPIPFFIYAVQWKSTLRFIVHVEFLPNK